jgi:hypothetical protein
VLDRCRILPPVPVWIVLPVLLGCAAMVGEPGAVDDEADESLLDWCAVALLLLLLLSAVASMLDRSLLPLPLLSPAVVLLLPVAQPVTRREEAKAGPSCRRVIKRPRTYSCTH